MAPAHHAQPGGDNEQEAEREGHRDGGMSAGKAGRRRGLGPVQQVGSAQHFGFEELGSDVRADDHDADPDREAGAAATHREEREREAGDDE